MQVRLFSGAQWAAAYSGTTRPGCGASFGVFLFSADTVREAMEELAE